MAGNDKHRRSHLYRIALNSDELIGIVDNLMYRVKSSGKNSIRYEVLKR